MFTFKLNRSQWIVGVENTPEAEYVTSLTYQRGLYLNWLGYGPFFASLWEGFLVPGVRDFDIHTCSIPPLSFRKCNILDALKSMTRISYPREFSEAVGKKLQFVEQIHTAANLPYYNFPLTRTLNNEERKKYRTLVNEAFAQS